MSSKRSRRAFGAFALALCAPAPFASAQWDAAASEGGQSTDAIVAPAPPPAPPDQMVSSTPATTEPAPPPEEQGLQLGFTWSLGMGVPIILDVPREVVRPGANLFFFGGADFGYFIIGGVAGLQWNPIDFGSGVRPPGSDVVLTGRSPLTRIYLSLPEVRIQVPNLKAVLPYLSGSFDLNFWNFRETAVGCGYWYCSTYSVYRFTPGFTGKAGLAFKIKGGPVHIDLAFQYSFTGKGDFFPQSGWWLAPVVGVLVRKR